MEKMGHSVFLPSGQNLLLSRFGKYGEYSKCHGKIACAGPEKQLTEASGSKGKSTTAQERWRNVKKKKTETTVFGILVGSRQ